MPAAHLAERHRPLAVLLILNLLLTFAALLLAGLAVWRASEAAAETDALARYIDARPGPAVSDEAIAQGLERLIAKRREQARQRLFARYELAPEQPVDGEWVYGNPEARFVIREYADYECPFCKRFHGTPKALVDGSDGRAVWQWRHLPLDFHEPAATREALAAECAGELAGNRGFWVFTDLLFQHTRSNGQGVPDLDAVARQAGLDPDALRTCLAERRHLPKIQAHLREAAELGIRGTPTTVVIDRQTGRREVVRGAVPAEAVLAAVRRLMLAAADEPAPATATPDAPEAPAPASSTEAGPSGQAEAPIAPEGTCASNACGG